ncbi:Tripartite-type tricarboxylate transporter, receptor component TctC [Anaerovirgula multivorans]|uniref:Tripartite-type tricarboxylate transporter, receptor component TctC n=1 Tax=Anaerovirgula multivorans TaxID=312168 RepID=A0A239AWZ9_9FIRM|nr:tripartite tricarboxylate transporter substrate binding protein [Anaerovirgula multivorans]SNS00256.1 Tripartite-type tricarboxylate transporter, receptor component TctC [Anaerovirgula multivorans]
MKRKSIILIAVIMMFSLIMTGCGSKEYPQGGQITVIIPKSPGGGTDITARGLIQYMKEHAEGATFVPTNKPDGNGVTGMVETANAKKDGYTLGMVTVELAMFPHLDRSPVTYEDFIPIAAPIADPAAVIVPVDAPYQTLQEFIDYAKAHPGELQVGNSGTGAIWHLAAVAMEDQFGIELTHVPYSEGTAPSIAAVVGGHIDAVMSSPSAAKAQVDAGALKILAVMADERTDIFPEVPTFKELGFDFSIRAWAALVAPKDTPEEIVDYLVTAAQATVNDPAFKEYLSKQGISPVDITGDEVYKMMEADHKYYGELLKMVDVQ